MSKRTWTGEELQQHLDEWDEQMRNGNTLDWTLTVKATIDPWQQDDCILTCGDDHISLTMTQAFVVQDWFHSHTTIQASRAVPTSPRDTQFAGFAALLLKEMWPELLGLFSNEPANEDDIIVEKAVEQMIARRTYDLLKHGMKYLHDWMPDISDIPDMTAWPKDGEE